MGYTAPSGTAFNTSDDGLMSCWFLSSHLGGLNEQEQLKHLIAHANTCQVPGGAPYCPCGPCRSLRSKYADRMLGADQARRFQMAGGQLEVGDVGEHDIQILPRLLDRLGVPDGEREGWAAEGRTGKGYFVVIPSGNSIAARLFPSPDESEAHDARLAFAGWAQKKGHSGVEWLPSE